MYRLLKTFNRQVVLNTFDLCVLMKYYVLPHRKTFGVQYLYIEDELSNMNLSNNAWLKEKGVFETVM